jgi:predicted amidohydrolase YtcJ
MPFLPSSPLLVAAILAAAAPPMTADRADLVIVNAHVWTVDDARPEAEAVAVRGDRIVLVGTSDEVRRLAGYTDTM